MSLLALCWCSAMLGGCSTLPALHGRTSSNALSPAEARMTRLGRALTPRVERHPGKSGIFSLIQARDAYAARVLLAGVADRTLDVQYYIWRDDLTGTLLLEALHTAADRGVRVRLLLDDNGTSGLDTELAALDSHPNIEVRLFNPFIVRSPKALGYLTDFSRINRRMHNKSFTVDNQASIIGGRNVGDEYFGATEEVLFADLDVLAVGPVVSEVSADFDRYWSSASAYPVGLLLPAVDPVQLQALAERASIIERDPKAAAYVSALTQLPFIRELLHSELPLEWAVTRLVSDDPAKGLGKASQEGLLTHQLRNILGFPEHEVVLVSPYFVPTAAGVEALTALARRGVKVQVLTNSLVATDVAAVHAGYAKYRKDLLAGGVALYEMQSGEARRGYYKVPAPLGNSSYSLHAKTFAVDRSRVFVGSFNFDPRSANLNTELGLVIDSPVLAGRIEDVFAHGIPANSYEVLMGADGELYWVEQRDGKLRRYDSEPGAGFWERVKVGFLSMLPIEWML